MNFFLHVCTWVYVHVPWSHCCTDEESEYDGREEHMDIDSDVSGFSDDGAARKRRAMR